MRAWLFAAGRPPVRHTYPARTGEIPTSDKAGANRDFCRHKGDYTNENGPGAWTRLEIKINYRTLEFTNLPSIVHGLIFSVDAFSGWFTNMQNLEIFFGFMVLLSVAVLDRGKLSCKKRTSMANRRSNSLSVNSFE